MKTRSAKAKGRKLQDWVKKQLISYLELPVETDLIRTAVMGESGADVQLMGILKKQFPFSIECKNQEKYKGIYDVLAQATTHSRMEPLGIIKMNRNKPIVVLDAEYFLQIFFNKDNDKQG